MQKNDDYDVAIGMEYGVALLKSWSKFLCNPKHVLQELEGPLRLLPSLKVYTLNVHIQVGQHISPIGTSPYAPTWLFENICIQMDTPP